LITITFSAGPFTNLIDAAPAPEDPVSGTFAYSAASPNAPINSLSSISVSIAGHPYALADVGALSDSGIGYVGGLIDGVLGSGNFENDFQIVWDMSSLLPLQFLYSMEGSSGIWVTSTFSQFTVIESSVPEPGPILLIAVGLFALIVVRTRTRKR
jgi:hypothetical protein